jgi:hypothetical protein
MSGWRGEGSQRNRFEGLAVATPPSTDGWPGNRRTGNPWSDLLRDEVHLNDHSQFSRTCKEPINFQQVAHWIRAQIYSCDRVGIPLPLDDLSAIISALQLAEQFIDLRGVAADSDVVDIPSRRARHCHTSGKNRESFGHLTTKLSGRHEQFVSNICRSSFTYGFCRCRQCAKDGFEIRPPACEGLVQLPVRTSFHLGQGGVDGDHHVERVLRSCAFGLERSERPVLDFTWHQVDEVGANGCAFDALGECTCFKEKPRRSLVLPRQTKDTELRVPQLLVHFSAPSHPCANVYARHPWLDCVNHVRNP